MLIWFYYKDFTIWDWIYNIIVHGLSCIFIWFDFRVNYLVTKQKSVIFPLIFATIYITFNYRWTKKHHRPIYPILTFDDLLSIVVIVLFFTLVLFIHLYVLKKITDIKK
jgi:hypothetical protein